MRNFGCQEGLGVAAHVQSFSRVQEKLHARYDCALRQSINSLPCTASCFRHSVGGSYGMCMVQWCQLLVLQHMWSIVRSVAASSCANLPPQLVCGATAPRTQDCG